jgi:hypothetical protein
MPLFKAISINATGKSFCVSFKFLLGETEEDLTQALKHLREMLGDDIQPGVILTDKAESIRSVVASIFPEWKALLCTWHANKSISKHCKVHFNTNEEWEEFIKEWNSLVALLTVEKYEENHTKFKAKWSASHFEDYAYITLNWLNTRNKCAIVNT